MNRREFLGFAAGAAVLAGLPAKADDKKGRILFGACRGPGDVPLMKKLGYDFWEWGVASALMPDKVDASKWAKRRDEILAASLPMRSCSGFLPGHFRLTGPKANFGPALDYAERACRRADEVNLPVIVFGSGGARNVPGDFVKGPRPDIQKGTRQMADFCKQLAQRIRDCKVTVVIEPLRPNESNIVNYVWQGLQMVKEVDSPRIQQLADIYHMIEGGESADSIVMAGPMLKHCHIATKGSRQYPGANDTEAFLPYFAALKKIGYTGGVSCECGWGKGSDLQKNLAKALATMKDLEARA